MIFAPVDIAAAFFAYACYLVIDCILIRRGPFPWSYGDAGNICKVFAYFLKDGLKLVAGFVHSRIQAEKKRRQVNLPVQESLVFEYIENVS